jgi:predicted HAD superfamily Cof-like phosphohydrolase
MNNPTNNFTDKIAAFNKLYGLPVNDVPCIPFSDTPKRTVRSQLMARLDEFQSILHEEVREGEEITQKINAGDMPVEVLTEIADWLGDIQVYCASEMRKFGLDNDVVLGIIMASNMSKLGEDGKPIYDERGKVMKGPNYWRPEPQIRRYIEAAWKEAALALSEVKANEGEQA